jgi:hypothetical protein
VGKLDVVENNNGKLDAVENYDGKFRHSGKTGHGRKVRQKKCRAVGKLGAVVKRNGRLSATVGNSEGRRLSVKRNNSFQTT